MTEFQKLIYNTYLRVSRTQVGKPFKYRKDFATVDETVSLLTLRLSHLFTQYKHINIDDFFIAPFKMYPDEQVYLEFYVTPKAIKTYTLYKEMLYDISPDCSEQLLSIVTSLQFIQQFCIQNKIQPKDYLTFREPDASFPSFILHLKERYVNIYTLQDYSNLHAELFGQDKNWLEFFFGQLFVDRLDSFRTRFLASTKAKLLVRQGMKKITSKVEKSAQGY